MNKLENWTEVCEGLYRYAIAANAAYEIHILRWYKDIDILTAYASLFITGEWKYISKCFYISGFPFFNRKRILTQRPVCECLEAAVKDYKKRYGITIYNTNVITNYINDPIKEE